MLFLRDDRDRAVLMDSISAKDTGRAEIGRVA
jgi:hypothetical protein